MHWRALSIAVLMAAVAAGKPALARAQDWAQKMFDHQDYDFGSVARGAEAQHRFPIKNVYQEDIHISGVSSSCGCTLPRLSQDLLKSGETAYVIADFDTRSFQGPHSATVTVRFDGQFSGEVRLQVKGNIRKDVVFIPGKIDLGTVDAGNPMERKIHVAYAGRSDWQIVDVRSANPNFEVELAPKDRTAGRVDYELLFRLKPTATAGYINDRLTIVTNDSANRLIPLAVEGNVVASVTVSPSSLQMGTVKPGSKVTKQLIVKGKGEFHVLRVECDDPAFKFQVNEQAKKLHLIPVTYTAGDKAGKFVKKLRIFTDATSAALPEVVAHVVVEGDAAPAAAPATEKSATEKPIAEKPSSEKPAEKSIEKPASKGMEEPAKPAVTPAPENEKKGSVDFLPPTTTPAPEVPLENPKREVRPDRGQPGVKDPAARRSGPWRIGSLP
ncbi:MAG: DUF1573 domain-containing protein [Planctomycetes bacterium]|nr:DUF1573 domain-containing protein [Planctomycetota bacterium]